MGGGMHNTSLSLIRMLALTLLLCTASACGDSSDSADGLEVEDSGKTAEELYTEARDELSEGNYRKAALLFDDVERQRPYSELAPRSQIMSAYSHYEAQQYDDAIIALERFIELYPGDQSIDYAYYLIALSYYEQISDVGRDQGMTRKAAKALKDVLRRFPGSDYAKDAKLKLDLTYDHLAGKEMMVGRYYLDRKEYLAAAGRFQEVVTTYQTTTHIPEALHRLVEVYLLLGVRDQAERYAAVLGHNYPESEWYERSYELLEAQ